MYKITSLQQIIDCFGHKDTWGVTELSRFVGKDRSLVHRYIKVLVDRKVLAPIGSGSHTKYHLVHTSFTPIQSSKRDYIFSYTDSRVLEEYFLKFAPNGAMMSGKEGFIRWCEERKFDPMKKITVFIKLAHYINHQKNTCGLLDVSRDFRSHIEGSAIDQLFYADQYTWMEFGRGKLAELAFYAKDTQSLKLIKQTIGYVKHQIECLIRQSGVDALAFMPHSRKRHIQFLTELRKSLAIDDLPVITLVKYSPYGITITQKSLKTRQQRIQNAQQTILLPDPAQVQQYKKVLLIDDFVGSGATLNETAKKFKNAGVQHIVAFALVGNSNLSYEVINEI